MSEQEDLEKGVIESKARQVIESVSTYLDTLTAKIAETEQRHKWSSRLYMAAWLAWVIAAFLPDQIHYLFTMVFMMALIYDQFWFCRMMRAYGEFRGCVETLRLLGYIPPREAGGEKKKRRIVSEFVDVVKGWAITKKKAQDKVFAPA